MRDVHLGLWEIASFDFRFPARIHNSSNLVTNSSKANFYLFLNVCHGRFGPRCPPKSYLRHILAAAIAVCSLFPPSVVLFVPVPELARDWYIAPALTHTGISYRGIYDYCGVGNTWRKHGKGERSALFKKLRGVDGGFDKAVLLMRLQRIEKRTPS